MPGRQTKSSPTGTESMYFPEDILTGLLLLFTLLYSKFDPPLPHKNVHSHTKLSTPTEGVPIEKFRTSRGGGVVGSEKESENF